MQYTLEILLLLTLTVATLAGWVMTILGMPGNWLVVALAAGTYFLTAQENAANVGLVPVLLCTSVASIGEALELAASALGTSRLGASKRANALAIVGSVAGAIAGLFAGALIPIPIVGSVIGSLLLGGLGATLGAVGGERWKGRSWDDSLQVGHAAFWGRLFGTAGKVVCGTVVCLIFLVAIWKG